MTLNKTSIDFSTYTWNPITGCRQGCRYCYARRIAERDQKNLEPTSFLSSGFEINEHRGIPFPYGFIPTLHPYRLNEPLEEKDGKFIFTCSMGDLFDKAFPNEYRAKVFQVMNKASWHTFMLITKNPKELKNFISEYSISHIPNNLWIGVTAENNQKAKKRVPILLSIPDINCFLIMEPLLGRIDLELLLTLKTNNRIKYLILGGQTGKDAVPLNPEWVREIKNTALKYNIPFNFKQWGEWEPKEALLQRYDPEELLPLEKFIWENGEIMLHIGKQNTSRLLDGKEYRDKILFLGRASQEKLF